MNQYIKPCLTIWGTYPQCEAHINMGTTLWGRTNLERHKWLMTFVVPIWGTQPCYETKSNMGTTLWRGTSYEIEKAYFKIG